MGRFSKNSRYARQLRASQPEQSGHVANWQAKDEAADSNDAAYRFAHEATKVEADKAAPPIHCEHQEGCTDMAGRYPTFPPGGWVYTTCESCNHRLCGHHANTHIGQECWQW